MTATYRLDLRAGSTGTKYAEIVDFQNLTATNRVNAAGVLRARLSGDVAALSTLAHNDQVELWRRDAAAGVTWVREWSGLFLGQRREQDEVEDYTLTAYGDNSLLSRRIVNWPAGTTDRSKFIAQPAETIMKTLVDYNCGANATVVNGRKRAGVITGVSVQADGGAGTALDVYCFGDYVLDALRGVASIGGGDFNLVKNTAGTAWVFTWYLGQLGTDRTTTVKFSLENGNMGQPVYEYDRAQERSVACVWGRNQGAARAYTTVTSDTYDATTNDREFFVNASDVETTDGLTDRGNRECDEKQAREKFGFKVLQTPGSSYGVHYFLGDKVTVRNPFTGTEVTQKIAAVTIGLATDGAESIGIELETP